MLKLMDLMEPQSHKLSQVWPVFEHMFPHLHDLLSTLICDRSMSMTNKGGGLHGMKAGVNGYVNNFQFSYRYTGNLFVIDY